MTRKLIIIIVLIVCASMLSAQSKPDKANKPLRSPKYIGAKKCIMCHKKDGVGMSWRETAHAKAFEVLNAKQKKNQDCLPCHATGAANHAKHFPGVQCEACHGAGSEYKGLKNMKDRRLAVSKGLIIAGEKTCRNCHRDTLPKQCKLEKKFDFQKMFKAGTHVMPSKSKQK